MPDHSLSERELWRLNSSPEANSLQGTTRSVTRTTERLQRAQQNLVKAQADFDEVVADICELKCGSREGGTLLRDETGNITGIRTAS